MAQKKTYRQLNEELAQIIAWFEGESVDLDEAIIQYEKAAKILDEMQKYLKTAENKIKKITARLGEE